MDLNLAGRRVLLTGGSRGIGAATVRLLVQLGAKVAFTFQQRSDAAAALVEELGASALALRADQGSREDARRAVAEAEAAFGGLDAFVGNAGIWVPTPAVYADEAALQQTLDLNLRGLFRWNAEVVPALQRAGGGAIVLLSSTAGQRGEAGYGAYAATKGAVIALTKSLATELGPQRIRVNCVAPGWVDTDMAAPALRADPSERARVQTLFPLGRIPEAADLAGPIAFLLSDWAAAVTGEILNVNGGTVLCG